MYEIFEKKDFRMMFRMSVHKVGKLFLKLTMKSKPEKKITIFLQD